VPYGRKARELVADDPAVNSGFGPELHPMPNTILEVLINDGALVGSHAARAARRPIRATRAS